MTKQLATMVYNRPEKLNYELPKLQDKLNPKDHHMPDYNQWINISQIWKIFGDACYQIRFSGFFQLL